MDLPIQDVESNRARRPTCTQRCECTRRWPTDPISGAPSPCWKQRRPTPRPYWDRIRPHKVRMLSLNTVPHLHKCKRRGRLMVRTISRGTERSERSRPIIARGMGAGTLVTIGVPGHSALCRARQKCAQILRRAPIRQPNEPLSRWTNHCTR